MKTKSTLALLLLLSSCRCESVQPCSSSIDCLADEECADTPEGTICVPAEGEDEPVVTITSSPSHAPVGVSFAIEFTASPEVSGPCQAIVDYAPVGSTGLPASNITVTLLQPMSAAAIELDCGNASDTTEVFAWDYDTVAATSPVNAGDDATLSIATTPGNLVLSCDIELRTVSDDTLLSAATVTSPEATVAVPESTEVIGECFALPAATRVGPGKPLPPLAVSATPVIRAVTADVMTGSASARFVIEVDGAASCNLTAGSMNKPTAAIDGGFSASVNQGDIAAGANAYVIAHCSSADSPPLTAQDAGTNVHDGSLTTSMDLDNNGSVAIVLGDLASSEFELLTNDVFTHVAGSVAVRCLGGVLPASVELGALRQVGGDVVIEDCDASGMLVSLADLREVGGAVTVVGNAQLESVHANQLVTVGGDLVLGGGLAADANPLLDEVDLAALTTVGGQMLVQNNAALDCSNIEEFCDASCEGGKSIANNGQIACACP